MATDDVVTLAAAGGTLSGLSFSALAAKGVDILEATGDGVLALTVAQAKALSTTTLKLTAANAVSVSGTAAEMAGLSAAQIQALGTKGVDVFNVDGNNGGLLSLTAAQTLPLRQLKSI